MSALVEAVTAAWGVASAATRESLALLVRSAWAINRGLAVPAVDPGFSRPEIDSLSAQSSGADVRLALDAYEVLAGRFEGLPLSELLAFRAVDAPDWAAVETIARERLPIAVRVHVETLRGAYEELAAGGFGLNATLTDSHARAWLAQRLQRVERPSEGMSTGTKAVIALAALYLLSRARRT